MSDVTEAQVLAALKSVIEPQRKQDIVGLGMVSGVAVREGHVGFAIEVDPRLGPAMEPLRKAAEAAVEKLDGVLSVSAVLTAERPAAAQNRTPGRNNQGKIVVPGVRAIIAVASGKGGVGKSTTAANLALALARLGLKIGVLDADIYGPSMPRMLGISGKPRADERRKLQPMENHGIKCMSMGFLVAEDTPMIWRGPMVMSAIQQMLRDVEWGELDVLVVDMPPGTGDAQLTLAQQVPLAGAVIVSTPQDIALLDARKGLNMFRKVDVPVLGIIENMSYFLCPHCGERSDIFSHGGARREAEKLGAPFLGEIPLDIAIRETSDGGTPIVVAQPDSAHAAVYVKIAEQIWQEIQADLTPGARKAPRIVVQ